jgi:octaprenyl-diphosphate synthase
MTHSSTTLERLYVGVAPELLRVDSEIAAALQTERPAIRAMLDHVGRYSGKKLRPALVLLIARALGKATPAHFRLGAIVEMIHLATLIHDDVIDGATMRRRDETANARWSNYEAVLLGDILFSRAINLLARLGDPRSLDVLTRAVSTLCEGEILQNRHRQDPGVSEALYYDIIREKTAVLYAAGCELAAHLAGASAEWVRACETYGLELGLSFQIIDDCLDLFGDEAEVGKSLGTDLKGGKVTLPVILALATLGEGARLEIAKRLRNPDGDATLGDELKALVQASGALEESMQRARSHAERAKAAARTILDGQAAADLEAIADFVVARRR